MKIPLNTRPTVFEQVMRKLNQIPAIRNSMEKMNELCRHLQSLKL